MTPAVATRTGAPWRWLLTPAWAALLATPLAAQQVLLSGSLGGGKALLVIDGTPQTLAVGATARGVTLERLGDGEADVVVGGRRLHLRLGASPTRLGTATAPAAQTTIVIPVGSGGHYSALGAINGKSVQFLVDTGATTVALSQREADRLGLDWRSGRPTLSGTANGVVTVHQVTLDSVRVGAVELYRIAAVVVPAEMPMVLLGNSFLDRFALRRDADVLRLEKKP